MHTNKDQRDKNSLAFSADTQLRRKNVSKESLQERQRELLVLELCENGERHYLNLTFRQLYDHVLAAITAGLQASASSKDESVPLPSNTPSSRKERKTLTTTSGARLGGYLHTRDMRSLVRPFSTSNVPSFVVRRHAMVLNFDPLRAIVLTDRLLVLVPDGADSLLGVCEERLRGGMKGMENEVFGDEHFIDSGHTAESEEGQPMTSSNHERRLGHSSPIRVVLQCKLEGQDDTIPAVHNTLSEGNPNEATELEEEIMYSLLEPAGECEDIDKRKFLKDMPFELQAVDVVLGIVTALLSDDVSILVNDAKEVCSVLTDHNRKSKISHLTFEAFRVLKNEATELEARLKGFERALDEVLEDDENLALMNLSRLVSHPERFITPISSQILDEESGKPELILESYVQHAHSDQNSLSLLIGRMKSTSLHVQFKLDTIQNRLLFVDTVLNAINLVLKMGTMFTTFLGMNVTATEDTGGIITPFYPDEDVFLNVTISIVVACTAICIPICWSVFQMSWMLI